MLSILNSKIVRRIAFGFFLFDVLACVGLAGLKICGWAMMDLLSGVSYMGLLFLTLVLLVYYALCRTVSLRRRIAAALFAVCLLTSLVLGLAGVRFADEETVVVLNEERYVVRAVRNFWFDPPSGACLYKTEGPFYFEERPVGHLDFARNDSSWHDLAIYVEQHRWGIVWNDDEEFAVSPGTLTAGTGA